MKNKLKIIPNIVKEYYEIVDLFIKCEKLSDFQASSFTLFTHNRLSVLLYMLRFFFICFQHFNVGSFDLIHQKQGCIL